MSTQHWNNPKSSLALERTQNYAISKGQVDKRHNKTEIALKVKLPSSYFCTIQSFFELVSWLCRIFSRVFKKGMVIRRQRPGAHYLAQKRLFSHFWREVERCAALHLLRLLLLCECPRDFWVVTKKLHYPTLSLQGGITLANNVWNPWCWQLYFQTVSNFLWFVCPVVKCALIISEKALLK